MHSSLLPFLSLLAAAAEPASHARLALEWQAPESCPSASEVTSAVNRLVRDSATEFEASVVITTSPDGYAAEMRFSGGSRTVSADSCRGVTEAVVVILALAIDPNARTPSSPLAENAAPAVAEPSAVTPPAQTPAPKANPQREGPSVVRHPDPRAAPERANAWRFASFVHGMGELGMLPGPSLGALAGARIGRARWFAELGALGLLPRTATVESNSNQGGDLYFLGGAATGCWAPGNQVTLFGCLGLEVGQLIGVGFGADIPATGHALWLAPSMRVTLQLPVTAHLAFEGALGIAIPLLRPEFGIDGVGVLHRPESASGRLSLGLAFF